MKSIETLTARILLVTSLALLLWALVELPLLFGWVIADRLTESGNLKAIIVYHILLS